MSDFTFLTREQIFGENNLDIIRRYGTKRAIITDFSILLGGYVSSDYTSEGNKKDRVGSWWTKTHNEHYDAYIVHIYGDELFNYVQSRTSGARPALPYSSIPSISFTRVRDDNGIKEIEYGEYPQTIVDENYSRELEREYNNRSLRTTWKNYTTDSVSCNDADTSFIARTHTEYEYNGSKYIRFVGDLNCNGKVLSDGRVIKSGDVCWVKVEPIIWLVDEKENIALSKKIIFSGVQFSHERNYKGDFEKTDIKQFMDNYFSKDIIPSNLKELSPEEIKQLNPYNFNFENVSEEDIINGAIESNLAVFLHGKSSEGKSARVKQFDPDCIILYLRNATPESLNGKSVYNQETGEMIDIKPTWLKKLEENCEKEPSKNHIVFLDEITNALPSIQGMAFNIVLDREVNGKWKLPENARIVAAGNDMKDSLAANQLAEPLFNRFVHVYIETTLEKWLLWASENNIHPAIYGYIAYKKGEVLRTNYNGETPNADPRKWEMASKMLYATRRPEMLRGLIGEEITKEFCSFCNQKVITLEDVLNDNYTLEDLEMNISEMYATTLTLTQVDINNVEKVRNFVMKLGNEFCSLFDSLWIHNDVERLEIISELKQEKVKIK